MSPTLGKALLTIMHIPSEDYTSISVCHFMSTQSFDEDSDLGVSTCNYFIPGIIQSNL